MKRTIIILLIILIIIIFSLISFKIWTNINIKKDQIPILMYHEVVYDELFNGKPDTIKLSTFEKHLKYFKDNNYKTLTLDEFYDWKEKGKDFNQKKVVLTFDDGFYSFNYLVKPLLEKYGFHATNFLIGNTIGETTKEYNASEYGTIGLDLINDESKSVRYESHSYDMHRYENDKQRIYSMSKKELEEDINKMNEFKDFKYISYPFNTDTDEFIKVLEKKDYKMAFRGENEKATKTVNNYQIPRIGINDNYEHFTSIFETKKYNNKYGNGLLRKIFVVIERKFS